MQITTAVDSTSITAGGSTMIIAGLQLSDFALFVGMMFTVLTFCMSLFFHIRRERRAIREAMFEDRLRKASQNRKVREASRRENKIPTRLR